MFVGLRVLPGWAGGAPGETSKNRLFFRIEFFEGFLKVLASILEDVFLNDFRMFFA